MAPMRGLGLRKGLVVAVKIDTLSLMPYEAGVFAWMGGRVWLHPAMQPTEWSYWLIMQAAMTLGFATTCPVSWRPMRNGIKERM